MLSLYNIFFSLLKSVMYLRGMLGAITLPSRKNFSLLKKHNFSVNLKHVIVSCVQNKQLDHISNIMSKRHRVFTESVTIFF